MMNRAKEWLICHKAILILIGFYIPFHLWLTPGYWDDAVFARAPAQYHYNFIQYTLDRYLTWSSRITIELLIPFMATLPDIIWKTVNIFMILLLFYDLRWTIARIFEIESSKTDVVLALLLCAYPFSTMAQTGWIATTMNYLWVVALGWYAISRMLNTVMHGHKIAIGENILSCIAVFYSAGHESMAAILLVSGVGILIYSFIKRQRISGLVWICMGITVLMLLLVVCCPGNRLRPVKDAQLWMPDYFDLTFFDKIRVGILSSYMHFVSIPSPIFFMLNLVVCALCKAREKRERMIAALPAILDVMWTCYFLMNYLLGYRSVTYQIPTAVPVGVGEVAEQVLMFVSVALWFAAVLYTMFRNMPVKASIYLTAILVIACIPEMAVGITPTVYASILRTMIYLYMAMIVMIMVISREVRWENRKRRMHTFIYFCLGCGMVLNMCQMARHIMIYG